MAADDAAPNLGEIGRRLQESFSRLESLAHKLEDGQFVRTDLYNLYKEGQASQLVTMKEAIDQLERVKVDSTEVNSMEQRIQQLEDDKKWLIRLVLGLVIVAVLGLVIVTNGGAPT
jgi:sugar-specific transcriptional regulator TrmB